MNRRRKQAGIVARFVLLVGGLAAWSGCGSATDPASVPLGGTSALSSPPVSLDEGPGSPTPPVTDTARTPPFERESELSREESSRDITPDFPSEEVLVGVSVETPADVDGEQAELAGQEPTAGDQEPADPADREEAGTAGTAGAGEDGAPAGEAAVTQNPFTRRLEMPEFPGGMEWLNSKPMKLADLKGKFVILDFWTYCCINCMHVLPELKKLEHAYPNNLVVIGVHSAKFETEKDSKNIAAAILRYEIEHPVVNDHAHQLWNMLGVRSWPTIVLIDPEGKFVGAQPGEFQFEDIDRVLKLAMPYYRDQGLLDETPLRFELLAYDQEDTPLRYPGKILADEAGGRLFITDSNHNRIVVTSLSGEVQTIIGSGQIGAEDGRFADCSFDHPQGLALHGQTLYVADTENHLLRKVDLEKGEVTTISGTGRQGRVAWPGIENQEAGAPLPERWVGKPEETAINSPWALWVHDDSLYIAMAGPHQIWKMPLDESEIGPYAGNGREDIVDGPLLPAEPYAMGASSFAQPSGLSSDGTWLYVADSEGSSIRAVPFDPSQSVRTVVGTAHLPGGRLFQFGDVDGEGEAVRLQHALEVVYHEGKLYVADTYNHKIKVVDAETGATTTLAGTGEFGNQDDPAQFFEPAGLALAQGKPYVADTNNHLIRTIELSTGRVETMALQGLEPPRRPAKTTKPDFSGASLERLPAQTVKGDENGQVTLRAQLQLPEGWKINALAPHYYWVEAAGEEGLVGRSSLGRHEISPPSDQFSIPLPVQGPGREELTVSLVYYFCQDDDGICKVGSVVWQIPLEAAESAESSEVTLSHEVKH